MLQKNAFNIKLFGFTLIELLIVMVITAILGGIGIDSYSRTLRVERRQDAILSLKTAMLIILDNVDDPTKATCANPSSTPVSYNATLNNTSCLSSNGFYYIQYNASGYDQASSTPTLSSAIINELQSDESVILKAIAVPTKSQNNDTDCTEIYLSNKNRVYPSTCEK